MARTLTMVSLALATLALVVPVGALASACIPSSSSTTTSATVNGRTIYYVDDNCGGNCLFSTWVYAETNGWPGLQRHDSMHDDTCGGLIPGDLNVV